MKTIIAIFTAAVFLTLPIAAGGQGNTPSTQPATPNVAAPPGFPAPPAGFPAPPAGFPAPPNLTPPPGFPAPPANMPGFQGMPAAPGCKLECTPSTTCPAGQTCPQTCRQVC